MARPHVNPISASSDSVGPPSLGQNGDYGSLNQVRPLSTRFLSSPSTEATIMQVSNSFFALVFATAPGTLVLSSGSQSTTTQLTAGINRVSSPLVVGQGMKAVLSRSGRTYVTLQPASYTFAGERSALFSPRLVQPADFFNLVGSTSIYNFNYQVYGSA